MIRLAFAIWLLAVSAANANQRHLPPAPPRSQVPPPPTLRGKIVHIPTSESNQTLAIQTAIKRTATTDTIFFDAGLHIVCGTVSMKAGQRYIGPSVTYPLLGQSSRAVIDGCSYSGKFVPASRTILYGVSFSNMGSYAFNRTNRATMTNVFWDNHDPSGTGREPEYTCHNNDSNTTIQWSTFQNGGGHDNNCGGANGSNYLFTHNAMHNCRGDCVGASDYNSVNEIYSYNYFDHPATNCKDCGVGGAIEMAGSAPINRNGARFTFNYTVNEPCNPCGPFAYSIVGSGRNVEIGSNYCGGNGCAIEWSNDLGAFPGGWTIIHDNFMDGVNIPNQNGINIFGPYSDQAASGGPGSQQYGNRLIATVPYSPCPELDGPQNHCMPWFNVKYTAGPTDNPGSPPPPASGSAP